MSNKIHVLLYLNKQDERRLAVGFFGLYDPDSTLPLGTPLHLLQSLVRRLIYVAVEKIQVLLCLLRTHSTK